MEITNFLTAETIITFTVSLVIIELWVAFTKSFKYIEKIKTRVYTFIVSNIHLFIINLGMGKLDFSIMNIYLLLCNALVIAFVLCGGFDIVTGKISIGQK